MKTTQAILSGLIYRVKRGQGKFNCASPAQDWQKNWYVGDVWICDAAGNIDPGQNVSPVPIRRADLGTLIGRMPGAD